MNFIQSSDCSFFDKTRFIKNETLMKQIPYYAQSLLDLGIKKNDTVLITIENVLDQITAIFALLYLECRVCLLNPKMPKEHYTYLVNELGSHHILEHLPPCHETAYEGYFNLKKTSFLIATSASSAYPKLICLTLEGWYHSAKNTCDRFLAKSCDIWLLSLPLFHVSGLSIVFRALVSNAILVIDNPFSIYPNARYSFVPTHLERLDQNILKPYFLKARSILIGGAKLSQHLLNRFKGFPIYITYGMTEAYSQISMSIRSPSTVNEGYLMESKQVKIKPNGEILIKGASCATHLFSKGQYIPLLDEEGYLETKDVITINNDQISIMGRNDERIEKHGEKIYPSTLETLITEILHQPICYITHLKTQDKTLIGAFLFKIPTSKEKELLKEKIGSLFFPDIFLELPLTEKPLKVSLQWLKNTLYKNVFSI